jgi:hypothetical protein
MGIIGFQSNSPKLRSNFEDNYLFARVDDNKHALFEAIPKFIKALGVSKVSVWGCNSESDDDALQLALKPFAAENGVELAEITMLGLQRERHRPSSEDKELEMWVAAIRRVWFARIQYHISLFDDSDSEACPMFDFMSTAYIWIIGKGAVWVGGKFTSQINYYTGQYLPVAQALQSPYVHARPFDGLYELTTAWGNCGARIKIGLLLRSSPNRTSWTTLCKQHYPKCQVPHPSKWLICWILHGQ